MKNSYVLLLVSWFTIFTSLNGFAIDEPCVVTHGAFKNQIGFVQEKLSFEEARLRVNENQENAFGASFIAECVEWTGGPRDNKPYTSYYASQLDSLFNILFDKQDSFYVVELPNIGLHLFHESWLKEETSTLYSGLYCEVTKGRYQNKVVILDRASTDLFKCSTVCDLIPLSDSLEVYAFDFLKDMFGSSSTALDYYAQVRLGIISDEIKNIFLSKDDGKFFRAYTVEKKQEVFIPFSWLKPITAERRHTV